MTGQQRKVELAMLGVTLDWMELQEFLPPHADPRLRRSALASSFVAALELARVIANKNPPAIRGAKRMCNALATSSDAELLQMESDEQLKVIRTPNQMEAVMAEMQKRKPNFAD